MHVCPWNGRELMFGLVPVKEHPSARLRAKFAIAAWQDIRPIAR